MSEDVLCVTQRWACDASVKRENEGDRINRRSRRVRLHGGNAVGRN